MNFWRKVLIFMRGYDIKEFPDRGYEIHTSVGSGRMVITDQKKYALYLKKQLPSWIKK